jgi:hypothetical protein
MFELLHQYSDVIRLGTAAYRARAYAQQDENGGWGGFLIFVPVTGGRVVGSDRETTQSTFDALDHWAATLSWVYLEGALTRALERQPEVQLSKRLTEIERAEARALAEADALERAAELARIEAAVAQEQREITEQQLSEAVVKSAETTAAFHERAAEQARSQAKSAKQRVRIRKRGPAT